MAFIKLQFKPGINRDNTNYTNEGGWWDCDKIRFRSGFPEKIGGWLKATSESYIGVARSLLNWITSYSDNLLAVGTNKKSTLKRVVTFTTSLQYALRFHLRIPITVLRLQMDQLMSR